MLSENSFSMLEDDEKDKDDMSEWGKNAKLNQ